MLERQQLLLRPWLASVPIGRPLPWATTVRPIVDPRSGQGLGRAYRESGHCRRWRRWLGEAVLGVYETEDDALLFTLHRPLGWRRTWQVRDADEHPVATFQRGVLCDGYGRWAATVERHIRQERGRFLGSNGTEVAAWSRSAAGTSLTFAEGLADSPFFKMAVLGTVLVVDE